MHAITSHSNVRLERTDGSESDSSYSRSQTPGPEGEKLHGPLDIIAYGSQFK